MNEIQKEVWLRNNVKCWIGKRVTVIKDGEYCCLHEISQYQPCPYGKNEVCKAGKNIDCTVRYFIQGYCQWRFLPENGAIIHE